MPVVSKILETCLYVEDIGRSVDFYQRSFGLESLSGDERYWAFSVSGSQVLLLFRRGATNQPMVIPRGTIPPHGGSGSQHLAFSIASTDLVAWEEKLRQLGIAVEGRFAWPRGGTSLYFRDPDGHLIELVTPGCWAIY